MEAISYGIPIIACKVCGIPEIVINEKTGLLLDVNEDVGVISKKIEQALFFNFNRKAIVDFFYQHFEANMNYLSFTKSILNENTDK
jgi:glycosyltransferase involved in cell wall biosynthesis